MSRRNRKPQWTTVTADGVEDAAIMLRWRLNPQLDPLRGRPPADREYWADLATAVLNAAPPEHQTSGKAA